MDRLAVAPPISSSIGLDVSQPKSASQHIDHTLSPVEIL
jgi:hypothetical protein